MSAEKIKKIEQFWEQFEADRELPVCYNCNDDIADTDVVYVYLDKQYCGECQSTLRESYKFFECCKCRVTINGHMVVRTDENDYCQDCAPPMCDICLCEKANEYLLNTETHHLCDHCADENGVEPQSVTDENIKKGYRALFEMRLNRKFTDDEWKEIYEKHFN